MGLAGRIKNGKVLFAKEMGKEIPKIEDAMVLSGQIELELKALDQEMEDMVSDIISTVTKDGIDPDKMTVFISKWPDFVERAQKGFDHPSKAHVAFGVMNHQMKEMVKLVDQNPLDTATQKKFLDAISKTALDIRSILEHAIKISDKIAEAEMGIGKALEIEKHLI
ncbi:hypothetical protein ACFL96_07635 [Thermoproteota archaeon]